MENIFLKLLRRSIANKRYKWYVTKSVYVAEPIPVSSACSGNEYHYLPLDVILVHC